MTLVWRFHNLNSVFLFYGFGHIKEEGDHDDLV